MCPLAPLGSAFYPVPVRRPAASLHASFTPASRSDALRFTSLAVTSSREDFHLQVNAHAGRTQVNGCGEPQPLPSRMLILRVLDVLLESRVDQLALQQGQRRL